MCLQVSHILYWLQSFNGWISSYPHIDLGTIHKHLQGGSDAKIKLSWIFFGLPLLDLKKLRAPLFALKIMGQLENLW